MLSRPRFAVPIAALLVVLAGSLAACGGGEEQSGGGSQEGGGEQQNQQPSKKQTQETKIAVGDVVSVKPDKRRMVVRPSQEIEGQKEVALNVRKTAEITLDGQKAEMSDIVEGQQANAEYVVKNDVNRAVSVQLFEADGGAQGGEDTSD